jgi:hypothetical protein
LAHLVARAPDIQAPIPQLLKNRSASVGRGRDLSRLREGRDYRASLARWTACDCTIASVAASNPCLCHLATVVKWTGQPARVMAVAVVSCG